MVAEARRDAYPEGAHFVEKVCSGCSHLPSECAFSRCLKEMTPTGNRWGKRALVQRLLIEELLKQGLPTERIVILAETNTRTIARVRQSLH